eukprot:365744-Chlamydomonas_euryale.AAC.2
MAGVMAAAYSLAAAQHARKLSCATAAVAAAACRLQKACIQTHGTFRALCAEHVRPCMRCATACASHGYDVDSAVQVRRPSAGLDLCVDCHGVLNGGGVLAGRRSLCTCDPNGVAGCLANMNALLLRNLQNIKKSASLQSFNEYRNTESANPQLSSVTPEGLLLEYETLELRLHPPNVQIDNEGYDDVTAITIDSANRPGTLIEVRGAIARYVSGEMVAGSPVRIRTPPASASLFDDRALLGCFTPAPPAPRRRQVVQCLTELGLSIRRARISSDGGWFVDGEGGRLQGRWEEAGWEEAG